MVPDYLISAVASLDAHTVGYDQAEGYYEGTVEEVITSRRLRQLFGAHTLDAFRINYARTPTDVLLERTQVQGIACSDGTALGILDAIWTENQLGLEAKDVHRLAYEFGDSYVIGWPDETMATGISLYTHDPRTVRVFYDPQRPRTKSHAIHRWIEQGTVDNGFGEGLFTRVNIYWPDMVEQWVSSKRIDTVQGMGPSNPALADYGLDSTIGEPDLVPTPTDPVVATPVPGQVPVFHFRNSRPYGRPEAADAYGPQNMLTKLCTTMMVAVDYAGYPQRYVTTDSALAPSPAGDAFGPPPEDSISVDAGLGLGEGSNIEAGPGSTWLLSGGSVKVGQFTAAETQNFLNAVHSIIKQMSAVTDVPLHYFDRTGDMPSGESFRRAEQPLNNKAVDRHAIFGVTWHELLDWCLVASGHGSSDAQVLWAPPTVWNDLESWQAGTLELAAGVPLDHVLRERGFGEDLITQIVAAAPATPVVTPATPVPDGSSASSPESSPNQGDSGL